MCVKYEDPLNFTCKTNDFLISSIHKIQTLSSVSHKTHNEMQVFPETQKSWQTCLMLLDCKSYKHGYLFENKVNLFGLLISHDHVFWYKYVLL